MNECVYILVYVFTCTCMYDILYISICASIYFDTDGFPYLFIAVFLIRTFSIFEMVIVLISVLLLLLKSTKTIFIESNVTVVPRRFI